MRTRRILALCLLACVSVAAGLLPGAVTQAAPGAGYQNTASESYYRLDVPNGTMTARVDATIHNGGSRDMPTGILWAMPRAQNIVVKRGDDVLETKVTPALGMDELPTIVEITLPRIMKTNTQMDLVMTYDVPTQNNPLAVMQAGSIEALFVSQGPGSFVLIEVPKGADNFVDPGCLFAADQPGDVADAGFERWVCGEVGLLVGAAEDERILERCANMDDRCRQRLDASPFSAFAQSITDPNLRGTLTANVALRDKTVELTFRFFKSDQAWAEKQFALAQAALPKIEALFGWTYPHETVLIRQTHHAYGIAFPSLGEVVVASTGFADEEITVHELAHQWAGNNLEHKWAWEGLAEWAAAALAPELGYSLYDRMWDSWGYRDPLATWYNGSSVYNSDYWYGKSEAFFAAYETALGGRQGMQNLLSLMDDYEGEWPLDSHWFMDRGEEISGANLDGLFLMWVYNKDTAAPLIASRRAAHDAAGPLRMRVAVLGWAGLPTDIQQNLDDWQFNGIPDQIAAASSLMDDYLQLAGEAEAAGLPQLDNMKNAWNTGSISDIRGVIVNQRNALNAIMNSTRVLEHEEADSPSLKQLAEARQKWAEGDLAEATRLGAAAATTSFNEDAAVKMIALAKEKQATFKAGFLGRIGLLWQDPAGDITRAEEAYAAGDPTKAMDLAEGAYKSWDTADRTGLMRLSALMGIMCLLSGGVWWLLRRLDEPDETHRVDPYAVQGGHNLGDPESRRPNWKDWENSGQ